MLTLIVSLVLLLAPPFQPNTEGECNRILFACLWSINDELGHHRITQEQAVAMRQRALAQWRECRAHVWPPRWWRDAMDNLQP